MPPPFDLDHLEQYVGDYYSDELGTFYTITIEGNKLVARHRRHGEIQLNPTIKDELTGNQWWFQNVHFMRDEKELIIGFKLSSGRVRNLLFSRK